MTEINVDKARKALGALLADIPESIKNKHFIQTEAWGGGQFVKSVWDLFHDHEHLLSRIKELEQQLSDKEALVAEKDKSIPVSELEVLKKEQARKIATEFYYWWHNQPGTNTQQGFDDWWLIKDKTNG